MTRLVLATANADKAREVEALFETVEVRVVPVTQLVDGWEVAETAASLDENARAKARAASAATGESAIADDTGLFVDALGGEPGVRSSRYAGPSATYDDNVRRLLEALHGVPDEKRGARFRTVVALVGAGGRERLFVGELEGRIAKAPRGEGGFGYDPVFCLPSKGRTLAQMELSEKNLVSHRARAFAAAAAFLEAHPEWLAARDD